MWGIVFYLIVLAVLRGIRRVRTNRPRTKGARGLCGGCAFVHMQYGATGRNAVFCTYNGGVRPVALDVLYCTDYRDRNAPVRLTQIGFVPEVQGIEARVREVA
jgi:hypothetical protein